MSVLLPNTEATVCRRVEGTLDEHGERVRQAWGDPLTMHEARVRQRVDGGWAIGLDPSLWPVREGDLVLDADGRTFVVQTSEFLRNNYMDDVDYIRVDALIRSTGGTTPQDTWFVGRYGTGPVPETDSGVAGLFTGHGLPPDDLAAEPGDEYLDLDTGTVYVMGGG